jgi:predicted amidohydrolase
MSEKTWTVGAIQMTSTTDVEANVTTAERLVRRAARAGAALVALPENFAYLRSEGSPIAYRQRLRGELTGRLAELAAGEGCYLLAGSIPEAVPRSRRIHNTSILFGPDGRQLAVYRKIHLFDIDIPGGATFKESRTVAPGDRAVVVDTPLGRLGLSICYDLRFPELYRRLALKGAQVLFVPSAFTAYTGKFHWLPLLKARAIENQCWVVAPAQGGRHSADRQSWGRTAVFDPWGELVAVRERGPGVVLARIDLGRVEQVRKGLPVLDHAQRRLVGLRSDRRSL